MNRLRAIRIQDYDHEHTERKRRRFLADLRAAGWRNVGHGVYQHDDGATFQTREWRAEWGCEAWQWYAERGELPGTL